MAFSNKQKQGIRHQQTRAEINSKRSYWDRRKTTYLYVGSKKSEELWRSSRESRNRRSYCSCPYLKDNRFVCRGTAIACPWLQAAFQWHVGWRVCSGRLCYEAAELRKRSASPEGELRLVWNAHRMAGAEHRFGKVRRSGGSRQWWSHSSTPVPRATSDPNTVTVVHFT